MCCRTPQVIARSIATKQSIFPRAEPWIASRSLSSGGHSPDPLARNDGACGLGHLYCFSMPLCANSRATPLTEPASSIDHDHDCQLRCHIRVRRRCGMCARVVADP